MLAPLLAVSAPSFALPSDFSDADAPAYVVPAPDRPLMEAPAISAPAVAPTAPSPSRVKREAMKGNPLWAVPLATLSETGDRPIFSASRRPPPVASISAPSAPPPPKPPDPPQAELRLVLVGTVIGGDQSVGIFVDEKSKATLRLKLDGDYQGWKLLSVHRREVIMARGELTETLELTKRGEGASANVSTVAESTAKRGSSHTAQYD
ncbi:general secretion pathway protein GspN [Bradyrhizobium diazoefficiens]|uniref:general secretion pathway protein GspN n=1 Tax=Bradyrhizobium diazoefficiens TaxID=1355477 RepID=UPI001909C13B|nr:general secretion pathway protein GspN [Bradyrhizobium diazoefficiens]QQO16907.1 general secretion pathway protein GspN [Bradyrhizobium diazoefficiens]